MTHRERSDRHGTAAPAAVHAHSRKPAGSRPRAVRIRMVGAFLLAISIAGLAIAVPTAPLQAQGSELARAMELEMQGRNREAAVIYRSALDPGDPASALLGLERVYAALGLTDSLLPLLDTLVDGSPGDALVRAVQLRALLMAGHELRAAERFTLWTARDPRDPQPYREYSRLLLDGGRLMAADRVLRSGASALGSEQDLALELAQLRARVGEWELSARSWRDALRDAPYLTQAAVFSLQSAPSGGQDPIRGALVGGTPDRATRQVMARLELAWGDPAAGWRQLSTLAPDDSSVREWLAFAEEAENAAAPVVAADVLAAAARARPAPALTARAAGAALAVGRNELAVELTNGVAPGGGTDEATRALLAVRVRALGAVGRPGEAERLAGAAAAADPALGAALQRELAWAWVRMGELQRAREALARAGADPDDEIHGWLEFYAGDLRGAREHLRATTGAPSDAVAVLALLGRTRADTAPEVGAAFLALARGDSARAPELLASAAAATPDAAPLLLALGGRVAIRAGDEPAAIRAWERITDEHPESPEAAEAELAWARLLISRHDTAGAVEHLERLILRYPESALVPQARRELDANRPAAATPTMPRDEVTEEQGAERGAGGAAD